MQKKKNNDEELIKYVINHYNNANGVIFIIIYYVFSFSSMIGRERRKRGEGRNDNFNNLLILSSY